MDRKFLRNADEQQPPVIGRTLQPEINQLNHPFHRVKTGVKQRRRPLLQVGPAFSPILPRGGALGIVRRTDPVGRDAGRLRKTETGNRLRLIGAGDVPAAGGGQRARVDEPGGERFFPPPVPPRPRRHHAARRNDQGHIKPPGRQMRPVQRTQPKAVVVDEIIRRSPQVRLERAGRGQRLGPFARKRAHRQAGRRVFHGHDSGLSCQ